MLLCARDGGKVKGIRGQGRSHTGGVKWLVGARWRANAFVRSRSRRDQRHSRPRPLLHGRGEAACGSALARECFCAFGIAARSKHSRPRPLLHGRGEAAHGNALARECFCALGMAARSKAFAAQAAPTRAWRSCSWERAGARMLWCARDRGKVKGIRGQGRSYTDVVKLLVGARSRANAFVRSRRGRC
jgi:hypothetical protein